MIYFLESTSRVKLDLKAEGLIQAALRDGFGALKLALPPDYVPGPNNTPEAFVSKIALAPVTLPGDTVESIQWKPSPVVVVINQTNKPPVNVDKLNEIEAVLSGFIALHGPTETIVLR